MASPSPSERTAISKLRARSKAGEALSPDEMDRLRAYDADRERESQARGASQTATRKVSYTEEETAAASVGTGSAAEAAALGAVQRASGERLDSILSIGISALQRACDQYASMTKQLLERTAHFETTQVALLEAMRDHFVGRAEIEAELVRERAHHAAALEAKDGGGSLDAIAAQVLPMLLGRIAGGGAAPGPSVPPNGKKKKSG